MSATIALLTDFGTTDMYVGVMKGVIRRICPDAALVDITHHIEPQNVRQAAFALMASHSYFPPGTVFLVVVDPGVGTTRRPIAVRGGDNIFVGPDNGVLTYALAGTTPLSIVELNNSAYHLPEVSDTFHGRDLFAPAAAYLAGGVKLEELGTAADSMFVLPTPALLVSGKTISGEVTQIDRFGNVITSIGYLHWVNAGRLRLSPRFGDQHTPVPLNAEESRVELNSTVQHGIRHTYGDAPRGELLALVGSSGFLELAVNQGSAAARLGVEIGDRVELTAG